MTFQTAYQPVDLVEVRAWGRTVGAVVHGGIRGTATFQYLPEWVRDGPELSPILMPNRRRPYSFPELSRETFLGLPPMIADSLPDHFGNSLIDAWMASQGVGRGQISALDRLVYLGDRGMGALEFEPDRQSDLSRPSAVDMRELVLAARAALRGEFSSESQTQNALASIIRVGTSAGGGRAKAVINVNRETGEVESGQSLPSEGFSPWLLKFDGMGEDADLGQTSDYGRIEYAYSLAAGAAGISMPETRLLKENGRAHFMVRRFDRVLVAGRWQKLHMQSLNALTEVDFNVVGVNSYDQLFQAIVHLGLPESALTEAWRRMAFNVVFANNDDHSKNFGFLCDAMGNWSFSPGYDITHAHNPNSRWTSQHLLGVNGKFSQISSEDLLTVADRFAVPGAKSALAAVFDARDSWPEFAAQAELPGAAGDQVAADFQLRYR